MAGVEIDPTRARIRRGPEVLHVRPKTYAVLLFLLENRNRLVTKEELVAGVWKSAAVSDDVITRSVAELRKAFGDDTRNPQIIVTFPRMGYGLMAPVEALMAGEEPGRARAWRLPRWLYVVVVLAAVAALAGGIFLARWRVAARLPFGEIAWWKLDEAGGPAADSSGHGYTGSMVDAVRVPGKRGRGVLLEGSTSAVLGRESGGFPVGSQPRTITAWIQPFLPRVDATAVFSHGSDYRGATAERFSLGLLVDGRVRLGADVDNGYIEGTIRLDDGAWHMVAGTYEGPATNVARIFVDGRLDKAGKVRVTPDTRANSPWKIGQILTGGSVFRGVVDDVRVYGRALREAEVSALFRCSAAIQDLNGYYYLPVFYPGVTLEDRPAGAPSTPFHHEGSTYTGIQLAVPEDDCSMAGLHGADMGQNLRISVDLLVPGGGAGHAAQAGPYFRSRMAHAGDGLIGGSAAGYWVQLLSTGMVKIKRLNPQAIVAFANAGPLYDSTVFHHLDAEARGEFLEVWLDGRRVVFQQWGSTVGRVSIPSTWNEAPRLGTNQGAAGIAFGTEDSREPRGTGGQRARGLQITRLGD